MCYQTDKSFIHTQSRYFKKADSKSYEFGAPVQRLKWSDRLLTECPEVKVE